MADLRKIYIDSGCFIDLVKTRVGKDISSERERDVWHVKRLLEANRDRQVEIFTSVLTIAECTHAGENDIRQEVKDQFSLLLTSGQYLSLIEVDPFIAEEARDLRWRHGINLRGPDALHVASAIAVKCEELLSTNARLSRMSVYNGSLSRLGITLRSGRDTVCLPAQYRQLTLDDETPKV